MSSEAASVPTASTEKWVARTRVYAFFWTFVLVAIGNVIGEENDIALHVADDYVDIVLAVVAIVLLAMWWKKRSPAELKRINNVMAVLSVLLVLATFFAISQEYKDPTDFGNEIPTLLFGIWMVINRFV